MREFLINQVIDYQNQISLYQQMNQVEEIKNWDDEAFKQ